MRMRKRAVTALILTAALVLAPVTGGTAITAKAAEDTALADELAASTASEDDAEGVSSIAANDEAEVSSASEDDEAGVLSILEDDEAGVSSISEDSDAAESRAAEATGKTQLAAPTGVEWGGAGIVMWNAVEDTTRYYQLEIYKDGERIFSLSNVRPQYWESEGTGSRDFGSEINESGVYKFRLKSIANYDPENYEDSEWSEWSSEYNYVRPDAVLGSVSCYWSDTAPGTLCWPEVEDATQYEICVYLYQDSTGRDHTHITTRRAGTSVDLTSYFERYGAGRYRCTVRALSSDIETIANGEMGGFSEYYDTTAAANTISGIISEAMGNATAGEALAAIKSAIDKTALRTAMQTDDTVLNQIKALESAYAEEQGITLNAPAVFEEAGAYVKADEISVVGAGLNAAAGQEVRLEVSVPTEKEYVPSQHYANSVQLDIQLKRGEESVHELDIPVTITLPVPSGVDVSRLVILHYSEDGSFETVNFRTSGDGMITFTVSRFSTFAFVEQTAESDEAEDDTDDSSNNNDAVYFTVNVDWDDTGSRVDAVVKAANGQNVDVLAGSRFTVPESVVSKLTGKKVTLALQTGNGLAFSITGTNVKTAKSLKMTLSFAESIPEAVRQQLTEGADFCRMFEMEEKENYPFRVNVHLSVGKENAGEQAYLYYYDESSKTMRLAGRFTVTEDGQAMFGISRGDEYIVVVGKTSGNAGNYIVVKGDTLSGIAAKNGIGLQKLLSLNPQIKDMNKIYPNEVINIR